MTRIRIMNAVFGIVYAVALVVVVLRVFVWEGV